MSNTKILEEALRLKPQERYLVIESLLKSLDKPDEAIDEVWAAEAQARLQNYKSNNVKTISFEQIFDS
ncbi:MAG: addiction module protein [Campylobacterota bacterium]